MLEMDPNDEVVAELADLSEMDPLSKPADLIVLAAWNISPVELQSTLARLSPSIPLLLMTEEPLTPLLLTNLNNRTWGILPIDAAQDELLAGVRALSAGLWVGAPQMLTKLFSQNAVPLNSAEDGELEPLTPRESEILQYVAQGLTNKQIAWKLSISEHTVKFHISSIYGKLGAANRTEAVRVGARQGIILL
ncbi:MAG: response regulator transcription factor [Anaerolineaceae bacterium]|nr:response regulator transcription factor [Anaerolineaceae bacterium]